MVKAKKPHFLEVFLPNLSSNRLKVPSKFVHHLKDRTSDSFTLIGPSGNKWHINMFEYEDHLFFREGWPTFVKDHAIQCGDTLVFGYDGKSEFTVQIFDESSCEKDEAFYAKCSQRNCSQGASEPNELLGKRKQRDINAPLVNKKKKKTTGKLKKSSKKKKKTEKNLMSLSDITSKNDVEECDTIVVLANPAPRSTDMTNFHAKKPWEKRQNIKKTETDKKKLPSIPKFIESKAANYFTSSFPYFIRVMCYSNISGNSTLKIPCHFSRLYLPNCKIKITLMNLNGDRWIVNCIPTIRRSLTLHTFCGGWIAFVRANNIKLEDVCIFELVGEFELRVRVLQMGLEGLESQLGSQSIADVDDGDGVDLGDTCLDLIVYGGEDIGADISKDLDEKIEVGPEIQQEIASFIDYPIPVLDPICSSSIGAVDSNSDELLLECNGGGTMSYETRGSKDQELQAIHMPPLIEEPKDDLSFTSPFPSFTKVMMSSNVSGSFTVAIPRKFSTEHLPSHKMDAIIRNMKGDSWNVVLNRDGKQMKICKGWTSFARTNNVKVGDICLFELLGDRAFRVQVLEGTPKVQDSVHNEAVIDDSTTPIVSIECDVPPET